MTTRLLLLLDEHWPRDTAADWVLLDAGGDVLQQGRSAPAHWPAAASCEALLAGNQCVWLEVPLPPAPRRERARLLAYALEDRLVGDPDAQHLTVTHSVAESEGRRTGVVALARSRMTQLVAQFEQLGRPLRHLRSLLQTAPTADARWVLAIGHGQAVLRPGPDAAVAFDLAAPAALHELLAVALPLALAQPQESWPAPGALELRLAPACALPPLPAEEVFALRVESGKAWQWWEGYDAGSELLHDAFAPRHDANARWRRLRAPAILAAVAALALLAANLVQIVSGRIALNELESRTTRLFQSALPGTPAIAPETQLARALERERKRHGLLARDDLLALLHTYVHATGTAPVALSYEDRRLGLSLPPDHDPTALLPRLALHGLDARVQDGRLLLTPRTQP